MISLNPIYGFNSFFGVIFLKSFETDALKFGLIFNFFYSYGLLYGLGDFDFESEASQISFGIYLKFYDLLLEPTEF